MFDLISLKNSIANVKGFYCDAVNVGMRTNSANSGVGDIDGDVAFIRSEAECEVCGVFTTNRFQAAPIVHFKRYPKEFKTNFILINAKNANAMTGERGVEDINEILSHIPKVLNPLNPIMSSTGVIGYPLPKEKIISAFSKFDYNAKNSYKTARAIMTTDSFEKQIAFRVELENGESFNIAAIAKGAGMINPSLATMLCFIVTDALVPRADMEELLKDAVEGSFNAISVDGDTSTNDTVLLLSNGMSGSYDKEAFAFALNRVAFELSQMIVRDGEGANKVVAFKVSGAKNGDEAKKVAKNLSNSLLVKTALFGEDPNWGRIASTIGASEVECDAKKLVIKYDDLVVYSKEYPILDQEREQRAFEIMKKDSFTISCDLGIAEGSYTAYGCDLSYDYVKINADYRT